jgi:hypothetical protein
MILFREVRRKKGMEQRSPAPFLAASRRSLQVHQTPPQPSREPRVVLEIHASNSLLGIVPSRNKVPSLAFHSL